MKGSGRFALKIISENGDRRNVSLHDFKFSRELPVTEAAYAGTLDSYLFCKKQGGCGDDISSVPITGADFVV